MTSEGTPPPKWRAKYESLISQFIDGEITAPVFEQTFLRMFKNENEMIGGDEFDILEDLFTSTDEYVADPELRNRILADAGHVRKYGRPLDDEELRACAGNAYRQLFER